MRPPLALALGLFGICCAAQAAERPSLRVLLTVAPELSARTHVPMVREATDIWRRAGVTLAWSPGVTQVEDEVLPTLRVLVVSRAAQSADERWPVGELVPARVGDQTTAVGVVSIDGARRVLAETGPAGHPDALGEHRLGVVLGRAIAHEIGHFLLGTRSHAASGLMRPRIDAAAFADLKTGGFFLDEPAARWIQTVFLRGPRTGRPPHLVPPFDYGTN